jgi:hypothetical protein
VTKAELEPDGYARITEGLQAAREAVIGGLLDAGRARERLQEANRALHELRQTLREVCLLTPGGAGPSGPDAA